MREFSFNEPFAAISLHPEEAILPEIWGRIVGKFMRDGEVPDYSWYRSKNEQWLYFFNRNELNPSLSGERFWKMLELLQLGIGRFSEWGFALRLEKKKLLVACSVVGFAGKAKIRDFRVAKVKRSRKRPSVEEVSASQSDVEKLLSKIL